MLNFPGSDGEETCKFAVCLTQAQLITVSVVTFLIIITVGIISLLSIRHNQFLFGPNSQQLNAAEPDGRVKPAKLTPNESRRELVYNYTPYEYVNWTTQLCDRQAQIPAQPSSYSVPWVQTSLLKPSILNDGPCSQPCMNPNLQFSMVNKEALSNNLNQDIPLPNLPKPGNQAILLLESKKAKASSNKCHIYQDGRHSHRNEAAWSTLKRPLKPIFPPQLHALSSREEQELLQNPLLEPTPFEVQTMDIYEQDQSGSVGMYAPFLCIKQNRNSKRLSETPDTGREECIVISNNGDPVMPPMINSKHQPISFHGTTSTLPRQTAPVNSCTDAMDSSMFTLQYLQKQKKVVHLPPSSEPEMIEHNSFPKGITSIHLGDST